MDGTLQHRSRKRGKISRINAAPDDATDDLRKLARADNDEDDAAGKAINDMVIVTVLPEVVECPSLDDLRIQLPASPTYALKPYPVDAEDIDEGVEVMAPNEKVIWFQDPRFKGEVGVVAFYHPGRDDACDKLCRAGFLGNFWDLGDDFMMLSTPGDPAEKLFSNAEAAFQALKFWEHAERFKYASGVDVLRLKGRYAGREDWPYGGYGNMWSALFAVVRGKFCSGSKYAAALLRTGDAYLLEHNQMIGVDKVWSSSIGESSNLLGLLLMLRRDELIRERGGMPTWTAYIEKFCQIDLKTGVAGSPHGRALWQRSVQDATVATFEKVPKGPAQWSIPEAYGYALNPAKRFNPPPLVPTLPREVPLPSGFYS